MGKLLLSVIKDMLLKKSSTLIFGYATFMSFFCQEITDVMHPNPDFSSFERLL